VFRVLRLGQYTPLFEEQEIDHKTLTQMEEQHFADIELPTGTCCCAICPFILPFDTPALTYAAFPDVNVQNGIVTYGFLYVLTQVRVSSSLTTSKIGKLLARRKLSN
jgi:hypothetical protein